MAQGSRDAVRAAGIGGPDGAGEAVLGVVAQHHLFVLGGEWLDGENQPEGRLADHTHDAGDISEHRQPVEEALCQRGVVGPLAARRERGPVGQRVCHELLDHLPVRLGHEQPGLAGRVRAIAEPDQLGLPRDLRDQVVVQGALHSQPRPGGAGLAVVQEHRRDRVVGGEVEVDVGEDDVGVLAAQLLVRALDRGRRCAVDRLPGREPACEADHVVDWVRRQRGADGQAIAEHEVHDAVRHAGLGAEPREHHRRQRRDLAGLDDTGVAGCQGERELPRQLEQRVVPRRDERAHLDRLVHDMGHDLRLPDVDEAALLRAREVGVPPERCGDIVDVDAALDEVLAGVERLDAGKALVVALQQVGDATQQGGAAGRRAWQQSCGARGRRQTRARPRRRRSQRRCSRPSQPSRRRSRQTD